MSRWGNVKPVPPWDREWPIRAALEALKVRDGLPTEPVQIVEDRWDKQQRKYGLLRGEMRRFRSLTRSMSYPEAAAIIIADRASFQKRRAR